MTRTDNKDGTWDILFDSEPENLNSIDSEVIGYADSTEEYTKVESETMYTIELVGHKGAEKKTNPRAMIVTSYRPHIKEGCLVYIELIDEKPITISIWMGNIDGVAVRKIKKDIYRIADKSNSLLYHYKYGKERQEPFYF